VLLTIFFLSKFQQLRSSHVLRITQTETHYLVEIGLYQLNTSSSNVLLQGDVK